jgi:hypothetical protein
MDTLPFPTGGVNDGIAVTAGQGEVRAGGKGARLKEEGLRAEYAPSP